MKPLVLAMGIAVVLAAGLARADEGGENIRKTSPHTVSGNCEVCHVMTEDDLRSFFTFPSNKKKLRKDFNETCRQCHGVQFGHGVGKIPKMNRDTLPLDAEGKIACAITCHEMHGNGDRSGKHLRLPIDKLCLSCHKG